MVTSQVQCLNESCDFYTCTLASSRNTKAWLFHMHLAMFAPTTKVGMQVRMYPPPKKSRPFARERSWLSLLRYMENGWDDVPPCKTPSNEEFRSLPLTFPRRCDRDPTSRCTVIPPVNPVKKWDETDGKLREISISRRESTQIYCASKMDQTWSKHF